jgi:hypothetical protein
MTKWEKFAKAKGIAPKPKKDKMVFDEQSQSWYISTFHLLLFDSRR